MKGGMGGWDYVNEHITRDSEFYKKIGSWNDVEKRRKVWNSVSIEKRKEIARNMGNLHGGYNKLSEKEVQRRLNLIKDIDMNKYGWVNKVSIMLNVTHTQTKRFINKYYNGNYFKRK